MELQQRLGLYQVFSRLYENNRELLDEILKLENSETQFLVSFQPRYVQAVLAQKTVYLLTNLLDNQTQQLSQSQGIWLIGRDRNNAIPVLDKRLSRHHAAIQYLEGKGFYLIDLKSTNGSFVNGEPVPDRVVLKDGDRVRLGSLAFSFFSSCATCVAKPVPDDLIDRLANEGSNDKSGISSPVTAGLDPLKIDEMDRASIHRRLIDRENFDLDASEADAEAGRDRDEVAVNDAQRALEEKDTSLFLRPKRFREDGDVSDRFLDERISRK